MKTIPLTRGLEAIVDDEDYEYLSQWKWWANIFGYACRTGTLLDGEMFGKNIWMHREIAQITSNLRVDHIDGNCLNNIRSNLRMCTHKENSYNSRKHKNGKSKYKGVRLQRNNVWSAQIGYNGKQIYLGRYKSEEDAAIAYNEKAVELFGKYAKLNVTSNREPIRQPAKRVNPTGYFGVTFDKSRNKWLAQAGGRKNKIYLGRFDTLEEARIAVNNYLTTHES